MSDAKTYIDKYFEQYPKVKDWMDKIVEQTKNTGYTMTFFGRKRQVSGIYEKNRNLFDAAKRIAINTPAQGTAAEIMKLGMINLQNELKKNHLHAKIVLQIHDELLIQVSEEELPVVKNLTQSTLEHVVNWEIPLKVTVRTGKTWQAVTK